MVLNILYKTIIIFSFTAPPPAPRCPPGTSGDFPNCQAPTQPTQPGGGYDYPKPGVPFGLPSEQVNDEYLPPN